MAVSLPEEYLTAPEADEMEKKLTALQKELDQFKNKVPAVVLLFENESNYLSVERPAVIRSKEEYVAGEMQKIHTAFAPMIFQEDTMELADLKDFVS